MVIFLVLFSVERNMESEVFIKPKGATEIQKVIYKSETHIFIRETKRPKIPKLTEGLRVFTKSSKVSDKCPNRTKTSKKCQKNDTCLKSLYELCIEFIAENAEDLESLEDFPLQIGLEIWQKLTIFKKEQKTLSDEDKSVQTLSIFNDAYPQEMLTKCKISNLLVINNYEAEINCLLRNCLQLSLTSCNLDENHDLLPELPKICQQLEFLDLSKNKLSSISLRLLFGVPGQIGNFRRFPKMQNLDISRNPNISLKALIRYSY